MNEPELRAAAAALHAYILIRAPHRYLFAGPGTPQRIPQPFTVLPAEIARAIDWQPSAVIEHASEVSAAIEPGGWHLSLTPENWIHLEPIPAAQRSGNTPAGAGSTKGDSSMIQFKPPGSSTPVPKASDSQQAVEIAAKAREYMAEQKKLGRFVTESAAVAHVMGEAGRPASMDEVLAYQNQVIEERKQGVGAVPKRTDSADVGQEAARRRAELSAQGVTITARQAIEEVLASRGLKAEDLTSDYELPLDAA